MYNNQGSFQDYISRETKPEQFKFIIQTLIFKLI